jgi:hypothetical protein
MPVYTVHAPLTAESATGPRGPGGADRFVFVRDGFHFWAFLLAPLWLLRHRLWLALLGYVALMAVAVAGLAQLQAGSGARFVVMLLIAFLIGFEAASLWRWTLSRRNWRQIDIVVAGDADAAERRFFDRWTARQRDGGSDDLAVDRGAPPPTREIPGQPFSRPPDIIGLFPQPGGSR